MELYKNKKTTLHFMKFSCVIFFLGVGAGIIFVVLTGLLGSFCGQNDSKMISLGLFINEYIYSRFLTYGLALSYNFWMPCYSDTMGC